MEFLLLLLEIILGNFLLDNHLLFLLSFNLFQLIFVMLLAFIQDLFHFSFPGLQFITPCVIQFLKFFHSIFHIFLIRILFFLDFLLFFSLFFPNVINSCVGSYDRGLFDLNKSIQLILFFIHFFDNILVEVRDRGGKGVGVFMALECLAWRG